MEFLGILIKEFKHILRDYRTLMILLTLPMIQMVLFGYAMSMEIKQINVRFENRDRSPASRDLIRVFEGSPFITLYQGDEEASDLFGKRKIQAQITIGNGFGRALTESQNGGVVPLDIQIDGTDSSRAVVIRQYLSALVNRYNQQVRLSVPLPVQITPVYLYNAELNSAFFFVPGLTALLVLMVSALLTSLTITREKENGTMTLLKLSPTKASAIIAGKVLPYLALSFLIACLIILAGRILFHVPVRGPLPLLLLFILLYCLTGLSFGMLISTLVQSQQAAMLVSMVATLLPTLFLSGFIFQVEAMPLPLQIISRFIPARYFLVIIRGVMLKGNHLKDLIHQVLMLSLFSGGFLTLATARLKRYLEA